MTRSIGSGSIISDVVGLTFFPMSHRVKRTAVAVVIAGCNFPLASGHTPCNLIDMHPITSFREKAEITQRELGEKVGLSRQQIWRIETGASRPSFESAEKLAAIVGVPALDLMRGVA
jgi:DNA-binding XRE family transcriptional regulator